MNKIKHFALWIWSYLWGIILEKRESPFNGELEVWYMYGRNMLFTRNANYSYGSVHDLFQHAFQKKNLSDRNSQEVLILGFGAGSVASILLEDYQLDCRIDGVELDPLIIELGEKYFGTEKFKPKTTLYTEDAALYVTQCQKKYDLIVVDLFFDTLVPPIFHSSHFLNSLTALLHPKGLLFFNKMTEDANKMEEFTQLFKRFEALGGETTFHAEKTNHVLIWEKG